ncbi:MAG: biotin/lipoyl-containing protein, partial [Betaproteobacteria bacterium]
FYFMEMNTRLQVEHPVTEMITGLDLVEWQLRVAAGERLPLPQERIHLSGHAMEARIYAEDPERGFLPSTGRIEYLRAPATSASVRVDTGVAEGDVISSYYDPMIAKLVVRGADRDEALRRLARALADYRIAGVATNVDFLGRLVADDDFANARVDTGLIARRHATLFPAPAPLSARVVALAALAEFAAMRESAGARATASSAPHSPWDALDAWWMNSATHFVGFRYADGAGSGGMSDEAQVRDVGGRIEVRVGERRFAAAVSTDDDELALTLDGERIRAAMFARGDDRHLFVDGRAHHLRRIDPLAHAGEGAESGDAHLRAPMSGSVIAVLVKIGDVVARGAPLLILEAMKMEHTIAAPAAGVVTALHYREGDQVAEGADMVEVTAATGAAPVAPAGSTESADSADSPSGAAD